MKKFSVFLTIALSLILVLSLCGCGTKAGPTPEAPAEEEAAEVVEEEPEAEEEAAAEETEAADAAEKELTEALDPLAAVDDDAFPTEGEYTIFGVRNDGLLVQAEALEMNSSLTLEADGGGRMTMGEDAMDIQEWLRTANVVTIVMQDGSTASGAIHDGIIDLDIYGTGEMILYYSQEGADISSYELLTREEAIAEYEKRKIAEASDSRTNTLLESLDQVSGVHLNYEIKSDFMDSESVFNVHERDGVFYSFRTVSTSDLTASVITLFKDGTAYTLDPEEMTGRIATESSSDILKKNILLLDGLYNLIATRGIRADYTEETRDVDGVTYDVEVFPAESDYEPAVAFYFDADGKLAFCHESARAKDIMELGEQFYTVISIDEDVDESLFDISGYTIE